MNDRHVPREEFVERLEWQIAAESRRKRETSGWPHWRSFSPLAAAASIAVIVLVSMAAGGAVVAAAYETQQNERRSLVASTYERKLELARQRLAIAGERVAEAQRRVSIGSASQTELLEARFKLLESETETKSVELELAEVRMTGQEPVQSVSAPLVLGRDFVRERWTVAMAVPEMALGFEQMRLRDAQHRVEIGVTDVREVEAARARLAELEAALQTFKRRIAIRQRFVKKEIDAIRADLEVLAIEAEQRLKMLEPQFDIARREVDRVSARVKVGLAASFELAEANLKLLELESQLVKVRLDLMAVRRQLQGK